MLLLQVEFNNRRMLDVFLNGERVEFDEQTRLDFSRVTVVKQNQSKVGIYFNSGVSIDSGVSIEGFLVYQISIPKQFKGRYNDCIPRIDALCFLQNHTTTSSHEKHIDCFCLFFTVSLFGN